MKVGDLIIDLDEFYQFIQGVTMKIVRGSLCRVIDEDWVAQCGDKVLALKVGDIMVWAVNLRDNKKYNYMRNNLEVISESR